MRYEETKELDNEKFRRLTGVKKATFKRMVEILDEEDRRKKAKSGRKSKLCIEDRLLMALEYKREYRTYFHIGRSYGMSESTTYKIIKWIEDTLVKHPDCKLPGQKELLKSDMEYEVLVIDATETPVERPKKAKTILFRKEEKAQYKNTNDRRKEEQKDHLYVFFKWQKCAVSKYDGILSSSFKESLWDKYYMGAPKQQRQFAEQYKIVKRA